MVNTVAEAESYGREHPERDGGSWSGWCASLCWRSLEDPYVPSYENATDAGDASAIQSGDASAAPRGAFHYWGNGDGHVATDLDGGGSRLMMASNTLEDVWGTAIGTVSFGYYQSHGPGSVTDHYRGWALGYGPTSYADTGSAGGGGTPIPNEWGVHVFIANRKGSFYLITPAENGKLFASVLGGQDTFPGVPVVTFNWDTGWTQIKSRLVNPGNVPA